MSTFHIEVPPEMKTAWVRAAQAEPAAGGAGLAPWAIATLNKAAVDALASDFPEGGQDFRLRIVEEECETTWRDFQIQNQDGFSRSEFEEMRAALLLTGRFIYNGGTSGIFTFERVAS